MAGASTSSSFDKSTAPRVSIRAIIDIAAAVEVL
jgi:hypothetical protein